MPSANLNFVRSIYAAWGRARMAKFAARLPHRRSRGGPRDRRGASPGAASRYGAWRTSGLDVNETLARGASLVQIRGGKVTRVVAYTPRERAFVDLGLAPEADSP
jgi:hypothetical protein